MGTIQNSILDDMGDFQEWTKGSRGQDFNLPSFGITGIFVSKTGCIYFDKQAFDKLGKPEYLKILTDNKGQIALRISDKPYGAYIVTVNERTAYINCTKITKNYKIVPKEGLLFFPARFNDRTLIFSSKSLPTAADWQVATKI